MVQRVQVLGNGGALGDEGALVPRNNSIQLNNTHTKRNGQLALPVSASIVYFPKLHHAVHPVTLSYYAALFIACLRLRMTS